MSDLKYFQPQINTFFVLLEWFIIESFIYSSPDNQLKSDKNKYTLDSLYFLSLFDFS